MDSEGDRGLSLPSDGMAATLACSCGETEDMNEDEVVEVEVEVDELGFWATGR